MGRYERTALKHIYLLPHVKLMTSANLLQKEGGRGVQDGGLHVHPWLICVDVWQKPPQYCKVISLQLK